MALLDQILGNAMRGGAMGGGGLGGGLGGLGGMIGGGGRRPGLGGTVAAGVVLALLVKAARQQAARHEARSFDPKAPQSTPAAPSQGGGLGDILGGLGGAGGLGGLLGGLGGAGALGGLISQMQQKGFGQHANSWVGTGQNEPIQPQALADALGADTLEELQQQTGMPRETLLSELSKALPEAINEATPDGRLPADDAELHRIAGANG